MRTARHRVIELLRQDMPALEAAGLGVGICRMPSPRHHCPWLRQHDPRHLDRSMNHLLAALRATPSP